MKYLRDALGIVAALLVSSPLASQAETLTLCGQKVDYRPAASTSGSASSGDLVGIWVGDILGTNVAYSVDYLRCWALAIEDVGADGKIKAQLVLADSTRNMHTGGTYGTQGTVRAWVGQLGANGATMRFATANGGTSYDLQRSDATKMQGRMILPSGDGRLSLKKR
ncbi:MAG TPA: hypothetical protein VK634_11670 [Reyranella sp.]|nr:hypothetical protein [Reyranella sp.]